MTADESYMSRAVELATNGWPAPNPRVGCVVVAGGGIVGEGFHDHAGGPHAEVVALQQAGARARGATVYVTLEPCAHQGRTPPCTMALIEAGVKRVVVAVNDPNPLAAGGCDALRQAGIEVVSGVLALEAEKGNERFLTAMRRGRPWVVVKAAVTLDGCTAWPDGRSKWITSDAARLVGHRLRAECGAVCVGWRTVHTDNPSLTARIPGVVNQPLRVVVDPHSRLTGREHVFSQEGSAWWCVEETTQPGQTLLDPYGLDALMERMFERGQTGLLVEGGGQTIRTFVESGCIDRLELFVAPKIFGAGVPWMPPTVPLDGWTERLVLEAATPVGPDVHLSYRVLGA
ncbi:MAG: bifunctional diaminohydroxyphosphoribosylaminopyrimidine deaminase/5-amino-6-(5-phosphoribosylamino)uracil reductase RibD [Armatimonadetes bacterium]|nr:bifunctional diaminohydroxyphosphoribosylaminopyrimidine deaminase/5-amino-6-(5-phosphoribosylamino)uracil reductase RibD [Armatimonadota bacterium]